MVAGRNESLAAEIIGQLKRDKQRLQKLLFLSLSVNVVQAVVIFMR